MLSALSRIPFLCLLAFCIGHAASLGLYYADDAWFACMAKSLASGRGYATPWGKLEEAGRYLPFNPKTGVGPAIILPMAAGIFLFGNRGPVPEISIILLWFLLLLLIDRAVRRIAKPGRFLFPAVVTVSIFAIFGWHIETWTAGLGEAVATLAAALSFLLWASARKPRDFAAAGLAFGLAIEAKLIVLLALPALAVATLAGRRPNDAPREHSPVAGAAAYAIGCCAPIFAFEAWKMAVLGAAGYLANWREYLAFVRELGAPGAAGSLAALIRERFEALRYRFGIDPCVLIAALAAILFAGFRLEKAEARRATTACAAAMACLFAYWLLFSNGWPRYAIVSLIFLCLCYGMIVAFAKWPYALAVLALAVAGHRQGFSKLNFAMELADNGLFRDASPKREHDQVVAALEAMIAEGKTAQIASQHWATFADISFALKEPSAIGAVSDSSFGSGGEGVYAYNRDYFDGAAALPPRMRLGVVYSGQHYAIERIRR